MAVGGTKATIFTLRVKPEQAWYMHIVYAKFLWLSCVVALTEPMDGWEVKSRLLSVQSLQQKSLQPLSWLTFQASLYRWIAPLRAQYWLICKALNFFCNTVKLDFQASAHRWSAVLHSTFCILAPPPALSPSPLQLPSLSLYCNLSLNVLGKRWRTTPFPTFFSWPNFLWCGL